MKELDHLQAENARLREEVELLNLEIDAIERDDAHENCRNVEHQYKAQLEELYHYSKSEYLRGFRDARERAAKVAEDCDEGDSVSGQNGYYCQLGDAGLMRRTILDRIKAIEPEKEERGE